MCSDSSILVPLISCSTWPGPRTPPHAQLHFTDVDAPSGHSCHKSIPQATGEADTTVFKAMFSSPITPREIQGSSKMGYPCRQKYASLHTFPILR